MNLVYGGSGNYSVTILLQKKSFQEEKSKMIM